MIIVNKPINLNQLDIEINSKGLIAQLDDFGNITEVGLAENNDATESQLQDAVNNHIADFTPTKAALLERLGITEDEAKLLLS